jgi:hypothetical protein
MYHFYADDGRIITPPKELEPLLKSSFPAFSDFLGHLRFFYMADEIWDGKSSLLFNGSGEQIASILLNEGSFDIHISDEFFRVFDKSSLSTVFSRLEKTAFNHRRPEEQLTINLERFPCGYRCDMCILNKNKKKVRELNPKYCRYTNCATAKGYENCVECGNHNICDELMDSHYPGQCNLGLTANEITKMIVPYYMKWRLDIWKNNHK